MTQRKNTAKADENAVDETKTTDESGKGTDTSKDTETTKQAEERQAEVPTSAQPAKDTDAEAAASGSTVGAVRDGDSGLYDETEGQDFSSLDAFEGQGGVGTVSERNAKGEEFDVPYALLVPGEGLVRTSDSDDPARDWTSQENTEVREDADSKALDPVALVPVQQIPGQTFRVGELPNRAVVEAAGINYDQYVAGLPVRADVPDEAPRKGIPA